MRYKPVEQSKKISRNLNSQRSSDAGTSRPVSADEVFNRTQLENRKAVEFNPFMGLWNGRRLTDDEFDGGGIGFSMASRPYIDEARKSVERLNDSRKQGLARNFRAWTTEYEKAFSSDQRKAGSKMFPVIGRYDSPDWFGNYSAASIPGYQDEGIEVKATRKSPTRKKAK